MFCAHSHTRTFVTTQVFYVPSHSVKHLITHLGTVLRNPTVRSETFRREHQLVATRNRLQLLQQMFAYLLMSENNDKYPQKCKFLSSGVEQKRTVSKNISTFDRSRRDIQHN